MNEKKLQKIKIIIEQLMDDNMIDQNKAKEILKIIGG
jgi:hypothetical protein